MQFWKLNWIFFGQKAENLQLNVPKKSERFFFRKIFLQNICIEKKTIFMKMFLWTRRIVLTNPPEFFRQKAKISLLTVLKWWIFFSKKTGKLLSLKMFCRHVACSFNNPTERSSTKRWNVFLKCPKRDEKFFKKWICSRFPHWHVKCSFENSTEIFFGRRPKNYRWMSQKNQNVLFFRKLFRQNVSFK